jgi:hypothetical protein
MPHRPRRHLLMQRDLVTTTPQIAAIQPLVCDRFHLVLARVSAHVVANEESTGNAGA